jgi:hypothetical protein
MQYIRQLFMIVCLSALVAACGGGGGGGGGDPAAPSGDSSGGSSSPGTTTPPPANGGGTAPPSEPNNNPGQTTSFNITLSWAPPSTREDGTALTLSELSGYEVYYYLDGTDASQGEVKQVSGGTTTTAEITLDGPGTYYFAIAARDQNGLVSNLSNYVSATFN